MSSSQSQQITTLSESTPSIVESVPKRVAAILAIVTFSIFFAAAMPTPIRAAWTQFALAWQLKSEPVPASTAKLSDSEIQEIANMAPQEQAERLLERALTQYDGALDLIAKYTESWYGHLELQAKLSSLLTTALNSKDLRVRSAALEIELAGYNLPKRPESAANLLERIQNQPSARPWALWMLGVLANRGVEPRKAFTTLMEHRRDPEEQTRYWTIEGLSMLGTDEAIAPLVQTFRTDPSPLVRERAASALSQSGMLTREQRLRAVPDLLRMADDASLDATTRSWVFQALRDITGAAVGADAAAWRTWWTQNHHGRA
jgi:HEAT repeat protein